MSVELTILENTRPDLNPKRALYSTSASSIPTPSDEPQRPIVCDTCGQRAGALRPLLFHCAQCETVTRVSPGVGQVEYTLDQARENFGALDTEQAEASTRLEPFDYECQ